jgi:kynureninase
VCHSVGAKLLIDSCHVVGAYPVDVTAMRADFAIGGSYKHLPGGPWGMFSLLIA